MPKEFSQDQPVNHEAIVATYTPEMTKARDDLVNYLQIMKEQAKAAEIIGDLPARLGVYTYENGVTTLTFGQFSRNPAEAFQQNATDKTLGAMASDLDGIGMPGSDVLIVTYGLDRVAAQQDPSLPTIEQPAVKVEWGNFKGDEEIDNTLSIYPNGYVEDTSEVIRPSLVQTSDQQATIAIEQVVPPLTRPAEFADIQNTVMQVDGTAARYNATL